MLAWVQGEACGQNAAGRDATATRHEDRGACRSAARTCLQAPPWRPWALLGVWVLLQGAAEPAAAAAGGSPGLSGACQPPGAQPPGRRQQVPLLRSSPLQQLLLQRQRRKSQCPLLHTVAACLGLSKRCWRCSGAGGRCATMQAWLGHVVFGCSAQRQNKGLLASSQRSNVACMHSATNCRCCHAAWHCIASTCRLLGHSC
jgi:hypothetical protein